MIQGFVELAIQDYEARVIQQQKEAVEATQREEEHQRLLAEEEERMKREKEESEVREWICLLEKVKEIAEQDPAFLASFSLQVSTPHTTYPAVDGTNARDA